MASRKLTDLTLIVKQKAIQVIECCDRRNVDILIYCTLRTLEDQARLYRKGRSFKLIKNKMESLDSRGFGFLADVIEKVGPQHGSKVTYAAPGESYHNYGEAFDAVPIIDGKAIWSDFELYSIYGMAIKQCGLIWGGNWTKFKDLPHAQLTQGGNPLKILSKDEIKLKFQSLGVL